MRRALALVAACLAFPASASAASSITDRLTANKAAVEVTSLPAGTDHVGVAEATALTGGTVKYGIRVAAKIGETYTPKTPGYPYVGMIADNTKGEGIGSWALRLQTVPASSKHARLEALEKERAAYEAKAHQLATELAATEATLDRVQGEIEQVAEEGQAEEPPVEEPKLEEPPHEEGPQEPAPFLAGLNAGGWGAGEPGDLGHGSTSSLGSAIVRLDTPPKLTPWEAAGLKVIADESGPYTSAGVSGLDHHAYVQRVVEFVRANPHVYAIEVLNEPGGQWFWGSQAESATNRSSYAQLLVEVHEALLTNFGVARPLEFCSYDGGHDSSIAWGEAWSKNTTALADCDDVTVHPYGGTGARAQASLGNRRQVEEAHTKSQKPVAVTEVGFPTAGPTSDSLKYTEPEQATALVSFLRWQRSLGWAPVLAFYGYRDEKEGGGYGLETHAGAKKQAWAAVKAALAE